ncbi:hypothetical protein LTR85_000074 [Meristemomyces frigidus]|nr:hypothetical protein LTR85_000074 [Meristemomyces frigidus]
MTFTEAGTSSSAPGKYVDNSAIWTEKTDAIADFERHVQSLAEAIPSSAEPVQIYTVLCGQNILQTMRLLLRRPIYKTVHARPPVDDNFDVMETATALLENSLGTEELSDSYRWFWYKWTPWFALAIVLAELCGRPRNSATDRSWRVAQVCYSRSAQQVADGDTGLLWKPIARLMRKAKDVRAPSASEAAASLQEMSINQLQHQDQPQGPQSYPHTTANISDLPPAVHSVQAPYHLGYGQGSMPDATIDQALFLDQDFSQSATSGLWDTNEGMSWFNWEHFIDDVNNYGNV